MERKHFPAKNQTLKPNRAYTVRPLYPDYFASSNDVGLARYLDNRIQKCIEQHFFQSKR